MNLTEEEYNSINHNVLLPIVFIEDDFSFSMYFRWNENIPYSSICVKYSVCEEGMRIVIDKHGKPSIYKNVNINGAYHIVERNTIIIHKKPHYKVYMFKFKLNQRLLLTDRTMYLETFFRKRALLN